LVYCALYEKPGLIAGWREEDQMTTNLAMLRNTVEPLCAGGGIAHVCLFQGAKAYGSHIHPIAIPARENAPRDPHANFYWLQEDYLLEMHGSAGFTHTILHCAHRRGLWRNM
jgi:hypothetical protein